MPEMVVQACRHAAFLAFWPPSVLLFFLFSFLVLFWFSFGSLLVTFLLQLAALFVRVCGVVDCPYVCGVLARRGMEPLNIVYILGQYILRLVHPIAFTVWPRMDIHGAATIGG